MPSDNRSTALAAFLLRIALGSMLLAHSLWLKLVVFTLPGTAAFFEAIGLPGPLAYLVFAVEAVAGTLLLLGVEVRRAALAVVPVLVGATWAHAGNGWMFASPDGGWEYPAYLVVLAVVQALLGAGAFALRPSRPLISAAPAR